MYAKVNPEEPDPRHSATCGAGPGPGTAPPPCYFAPPGGAQTPHCSAPPSTAPPPDYFAPLASAPPLPYFAPPASAPPLPYFAPSNTVYNQPAYPPAQYTSNNPQYYIYCPPQSRVVVTTQPMVTVAPAPCNEKDYMVFSILSVLFFCILGIFALNASRQTKEANIRGNAIHARYSSRKALKRNLLTLVIGIAFYVVLNIIILATD